MSYIFMLASLFVFLLALSYKYWYFLFHDHSAFTDVNFYNGSHTLAVIVENLFR